MEYREPDDKYMKRKTTIGDTTDLTDLMSIPVVWFIQRCCCQIESLQG